MIPIYFADDTYMVKTSFGQASERERPDVNSLCIYRNIHAYNLSICTKFVYLQHKQKNESNNRL